MTHRTRRSWTISNDEIGSSTLTRLHKLFHHPRTPQSYAPDSTSSSLYHACQTNDLAHAQSCLKQMTYRQIDCQYPPNNETALHVATRNQYKDLITTLLFYGAQRSLRNSDNQQAYDLAPTIEIKDLFKRRKSSRFVFQHSTSSTTNPVLSSRKIHHCQSCCSLIDDDHYYEWELIDQNASSKAWKFRHELKLSPMNDKDLKQKIYLIKKGYLNARLHDVPIDNARRIQDYFERVLIEYNPDYIIKAFTISQTFSNLLNTDMARNVVHDFKNGCSQFSCDCLYSTEDGIKSFTSILLHHPKFQKLAFTGVVYRGIVLPRNKLDHYKEKSCIITTTFVSTSKNQLVAQKYGDKGNNQSNNHSFFCTYEIMSDDRTALDITNISEFQDEEEILISPYSAFIITKIEQGEHVTNIYLKEQCSMISTRCFDKDIRSNLSCDINSQIILQKENQTGRLRSQTMSVLDTHC